MDSKNYKCYNIHTYNTVGQHKKGVAEMADINIRASLQEDRGTYVVRGRVPNNKGKLANRSKSTGIKVKPGNKRKAEAEMKKIVSGWIAEAERNVIASRFPTVSELIDEWLENQKTAVKQTSYVNNERAAEIIRRTFGDLLICDLTRNVIQDYINRESKRLSPKTINVRLAPIRGAIKLAIIKDIIDYDPTQYIEIPRRQAKEQCVLSADQINMLLNVVSEKRNSYLYTVIILAGIYGLRREEICGLRWIDIDFDSGVMKIRNVKTQVEGVIIERSGAKSEAGVRSIKLTNDTLLYLKILMRQQIMNGFPLDKVCILPNGEEPSPNSMSKRIKYLMETCGIEDGHLHSLRHSAATIMSRELTLKQLQAFLGHSTVAMSMHYTHIMDEDLNRIGDALEKSSQKLAISY